MPEARVRQKTHKFGPNQHRSHPLARRASTRAAPRPLPGGSRRCEPGGLGQEWGGSASGPVSPPPKSQSPSTSPIPIRAQPSERQHHLVSAGRGARGGAPNRAKKTLPTPPGDQNPRGWGWCWGWWGGCQHHSLSQEGLLFGTTWKKMGWHPTGGCKGDGEGGHPSWGTSWTQRLSPKTLCGGPREGSTPFFPPDPAAGAPPWGGGPLPGCLPTPASPTAPG